MPSYSILFMRTDVTDKRPWRITIKRSLFWLFMVVAFALPVLGFFVSVGWFAPNWLKFNVSNMQAAVKEAEATLQPLQQQNAQLAERKATLETQLAGMRGKLAAAETKATMAATAHTEAANRLAQLEAESVTLKQALAKYEAMLKPKNSANREMLACNDLEARIEGANVAYATSFSKARQGANVPSKLTVQVRLAAGDNAMLLEQAKQSGQVVNHTLELAKSPRVSGKLPLNGAAGGLRMLDLKIMNGAQQVGYCWKAF